MKPSNRARSGRRIAAICAAFVVSLACRVPPPELGDGPDRPAPEPTALLADSPLGVLVVRPAALLASPLGREAREWFDATAEAAARGGPARWLGGLGGATEVVVGLYGPEGAEEVQRAVRGGETEGRVLAADFAAGVEARRGSVEEREAGGVRVFVSGPAAVAALGTGTYLQAPPDAVFAACERSPGDPAGSAAADPRLVAISERIPAGAELIWFGRVPASLRPRLQHWGLDPLVDRWIGTAVVVGPTTVTVRLVSDLETPEQAAALVETAAEGIAFAADRRSFRTAGLSPLIRTLSPRNDDRFFHLEGDLPTAVVAAVLAGLRALSTEGADRL